MTIKRLRKAITYASAGTMLGLWEHMAESEREDIRILLNRKGVIWSIGEIREILLENDSLLEAVYKYAPEAEKRDLEFVLEMI